MLAVVVVTGLAAAILVGRWLVLRGRGDPVPANGLSVAAVLLAVAASFSWAPAVVADGGDAWFIWIALVIPVAIAALAIIPRRSVRWGAAVVLLPFVLLTAASVGLAYLPATLVLLLSASATPAQERPLAALSLDDRRHLAVRRTHL